MITIKTTAKFIKDSSDVLSLRDLENLYDYLMQYPDAGKIISGTGGVRKLRWQSQYSHRGKSGGLRILYHYSKGLLIIMMGIYEKTKKENILDAERNQLKKLIPRLIEQFKE